MALCQCAAQLKNKKYYLTIEMAGSKSSKKSSVGTSSKKVSDNACCVYDFTLFDKINVGDIREHLKKHCKKYCFQLERGEETEKEHFQGRFSLKIKKRKTEAVNLFKDLWKKFHLSITSKENKGNNFYVTKEDTRLEGPFSDENDVYIPRDIRSIKELRPWQKSLIDMLRTYNERIVDVVFDKGGNIGKSTLTRYMMLFDDAELLPFCNDYKDIMRMAFDVGPKKTYLIDMPRAINKEKLYQFFSGIETLKSGYCYDDRYKFTRRLFDRPRICIFTNVEPDQTLLSKDMWKIWTVIDNQLKPYKTPADELEFIPDEEAGATKNLNNDIEFSFSADDLVTESDEEY